MFNFYNFRLTWLVFVTQNTTWTMAGTIILLGNQRTYLVVQIGVDRSLPYKVSRTQPNL